MPERDTKDGWNGLITQRKERITTYRCRRTGKLWEEIRPWGYSRWAGADELVSPDWEDSCHPGRLEARNARLVCNVCGGVCGVETVSVRDVEHR